MSSPRNKGESRRPPATTPESREMQLVSLAVDLAEEQIRSGKASAQVITHFLKLATVKEKLEQDRLRGENALLKAKVENIESGAHRDQMYEEALKAMRSYSGLRESDDFED